MLIIFIIFALQGITDTRCAVQQINRETVLNADVIDNLFLNSHCVQLVVNQSASKSIELPSSSHNQYVVRTLDNLLVQDIYQHDAAVLTRNFHAFSECALTLITADVANVFTETGDANASTKYKRFRPHTKIVVLAAMPPAWTPQLRGSIKRQALRVIWLLANRVYRMGSDGLQQTTTDNFGLWKFLHIDPLTELSTAAHKDPVTVSMYNCEPYIHITYDTPEGGNATHIDGIEYRLIRMLDRYFELNFQVSPFKSDDFQQYALDQLRDGRADIAMCCPWLMLVHYVEFDMSDVVDLQCGTFLVPRPLAISAAGYVYMSFSGGVWSLGLFCFVTIAVLMYGLARWLQPGRYADGVRIVLDLVCICTNHGLGSLAGERSQTLRILLVVWLFGTSLLGVGYSTGYASLLSSPVYSATVDTVDDYIDKTDFVWSYVGNTSDFSNLETSLELYQRLYRRIEGVPSAVEQADRILAGDRRMTIYVEITFNRYVTYAKQLMANRVRSLRLMKSCWYGHYTTLALSKYSAYTALVDDIIAK